MKTIANLTKKAMKWYFTQYSKIYSENYCRYGYKSF